MNDQLRWGVLGAGHIAKVFCNAIRFSKTSILKAVASTQTQRAVELGQFSGLSPRVEHSYEHLLQSDDVDAVYIANLNHQHYPWALASLQAGKHTLVEKPITLNEGDLAHLMRVAEQEQKLLMEGFMYRCHPQLDQLRSHIAQQTIGEIKLVEASFGYQANVDPQSRIFNRIFGGGALYDVGCYPTSLAIYLMSLLTHETCTHLVSDLNLQAQGFIGSTGIVEAGAMRFRLNNGTLFYLQTSIIEQLPNQVIIEGTQGRITLKDPWLPSSPCRFADTALSLNTEFDPAELMIETWGKKGDSLYIETVDATKDLFTYEIDHFAESVQQCYSTKVPLTHSLANIRLIERWHQEIGVHS